jgi:hypothetical protein
MTNSSTRRCSRQRCRITRDGNKRVEINARGNAHPLEHPDDILGRDIAGCAGSEWASSQPSERRIEDAHALAEGGIDVGKAQTVGIVTVKGPSSHLGEPRHAGGKQAFHVVRSDPPRRIAQTDLGILAQRHQAIEQIQGCRLRHAAGERAVESGGNIQP